MTQSQNLRDLANRVRDGESINWSHHLDALVLDQVANDAEYLEQIQERVNSRLNRRIEERQEATIDP